VLFGYLAYRALLIMFTDPPGLLMKKYGITANAICPK
jgi:NAD(P)-dependent dehydrogenase (short-subunit alcohol dehydrogenase family)